MHQLLFTALALVAMNFNSQRPATAFGESEHDVESRKPMLTLLQTQSKSMVAAS